MKIIMLNDTPHKFEKQNNVTKRDSNGHYDLYKCPCGLWGKRRRLVTLQIDGRFSMKKISQCPLAEVEESPKRVVIDNYGGFVRGDEILTKGSVHYVCDPPNTNTGKENPNSKSTVWVKSARNEPIRLLTGEFKIID